MKGDGDWNVCARVCFQGRQLRWFIVTAHQVHLVRNTTCNANVMGDMFRTTHMHSAR